MMDEMEERDKMKMNVLFLFLFFKFLKHMKKYDSFHSIGELLLLVKKVMWLVPMWLHQQQQNLLFTMLSLQQLMVDSIFSLLLK